MPTQRTNVLEAEVRAIEEGLTARYDPQTGTFRVRSSTRPGLRWTVSVGAVKLPEGWRLKLSCTCEAGRARPGEMIPCLHSAATARSLERRGLARWVPGGLWQPSSELVGAA